MRIDRQRPRCVPDRSTASNAWDVFVSILGFNFEFHLLMTDLDTGSESHYKGQNSEDVYGGVAEIGGGNKEILALELPWLAKTRLAHATVETIEGIIPIPVYATYMTPEATRIRNLYYEARQWTADPEIQFAWTNMVRDLCGRPRILRDSTIQFHRADS